jgi:hypothetical protein
MTWRCSGRGFLCPARINPGFLDFDFSLAKAKMEEGFEFEHS